MSYDLELINPLTKEVMTTPTKHHLKGGRYALGGTDLAHLNITYNYSMFYYTTFGRLGIRTIYGMSGKESIPLIKKAIAMLGNDSPSDDYWESTPGNAKKALEDLVALAELCPDGIWDGD